LIEVTGAQATAAHRNRGAQIASQKRREWCPPTLGSVPSTRLIDAQLDERGELDREALTWLPGLVQTVAPGALVSTDWMPFSALAFDL
jgi:hypothetical protein